MSLFKIGLVANFYTLILFLYFFNKPASSLLAELFKLISVNYMCKYKLNIITISI